MSGPEPTATMAAAGTTGGSEQLVIFALGGEHYALPIGAVSEIIRHTPPRSVVSASPWVRGVIALRGKIVPIYDLAARLDLIADSRAGKIVILEIGGQHVGITVDDVEEVLTVSLEQLEPLPAGGGEGFRAVAKVEDRLIMLLDPERLLAD